jgi:hypothetical protein
LEEEFAIVQSAAAVAGTAAMLPRQKNAQYMMTESV